MGSIKDATMWNCGLRKCRIIVEGNLCSRCCQVRYCSREHQREDWAEHKSRCRPVAIRDIKDKGKGLVATRSLKEGEVVLQELPLLVGQLTSSTAWTGAPQVTSLLVKKLVQTFNNLVPEQQALVLSLHAPEHSESCVNHPELGEKEKRLLRIFASNNIEIDHHERCGLYE